MQLRVMYAVHGFIDGLTARAREEITGPGLRYAQAFPCCGPPT
ncbi:hypothetical protein [Variovorax sp. VRV01]|nr:hypothetical protein [Variovorax sp. VRV01]